MKKRKIFVDSDVVLSSLISNKGAAYFLLNEAYLDLYISDISFGELERGVEKLNLNKNSLKEATEKIKLKFGNYVLDINDAHIVAGARKSKAKLIISYNIKDFNVSKLKKDLKIIIQTPSQFLQYLRSLQ